jgi:hypothetical protein
MKHLLTLSLILPFVFVAPTQAQQVNVYGESYCYTNIEQYVPGYYDAHGNYVGGYVNNTRNRVPCNNNVVINQQPYYNNGGGYYGRRTNPNCNPSRTILGAVLGGAIGRSMTSTSNNRNNRGWATALGASIGGLTFSC